jgi:sugar/nucleoside kinase (ribokinase family)
VPGGTGANVAVAAARILGPGEVALFGALGRDEIADRQLGILDAEGVVHEPVVRIGGQSSGHAYIFVDHSGQNVIASHLGANAVLDTRHARQGKVSTTLQDCRCIVLTDPPLPVASYLLQAASSLDVPALWDPGVLVQHGWNALAPLTGKADTLILNEAEARRLFGASESRDIVGSLDQRGAPSYLVLKQGERGSLLVNCTTGAITPIPPLPIEALGLSVVSTVGCGDVFLGAYAAYLSLGQGRSAALIMASAAAGMNAARPETRGGPTHALLEETMQKAKPLGFDIAGGTTQ